MGESQEILWFVSGNFWGYDIDVVGPVGSIVYPNMFGGNIPYKITNITPHRNLIDVDIVPLEKDIYQ